MNSNAQERVVLIDRHMLAQRIQELARQMHEELAGRQPVLVVVLKGGMMFAADLMRAYPGDLPVVFVIPRAAGCPMCMGAGDQELLRGRPLLVVDGLLDSGRSMKRLLEQLVEMQPAEMRVAVLLHKTVADAEPVPIHYLGFEVPDLRLVGYGLDEDQRFRNLPDICAWRAASGFSQQ